LGFGPPCAISVAWRHQGAVAQPRRRAHGFPYEPGAYAFFGSLKSGFKSFNVPHGSETQAFSINDSGVIAGSYYPNGGALTGFLRMP
jgi:hypothetical protein